MVKKIIKAVDTSLRRSLQGRSRHSNIERPITSPKKRRKNRSLFFEISSKVHTLVSPKRKLEKEEDVESEKDFYPQKMTRKFKPAILNDPNAKLEEFIPKIRDDSFELDTNIVEDGLFSGSLRSLEYLEDSSTQEVPEGACGYDAPHRSKHDQQDMFGHLRIRLPQINEAVDSDDESFNLEELFAEEKCCKDNAFSDNHKKWLPYIDDSSDTDDESRGIVILKPKRGSPKNVINIPSPIPSRFGTYTKSMKTSTPTRHEEFMILTKQMKVRKPLPVWKQGEDAIVPEPQEQEASERDSDSNESNSPTAEDKPVEECRSRPLTSGHQTACSTKPNVNCEQLGRKPFCLTQILPRPGREEAFGPLFNGSPLDSQLNSSSNYRVGTFKPTMATDTSMALEEVTSGATTQDSPRWVTATSRYSLLSTSDFNIDQISPSSRSFSAKKKIRERCPTPYSHIKEDPEDGYESSDEESGSEKPKNTHKHANERCQQSESSSNFDDEDTSSDYEGIANATKDSTTSSEEFEIEDESSSDGERRAAAKNHDLPKCQVASGQAILTNIPYLNRGVNSQTVQNPAPTQTRKSLKPVFESNTTLILEREEESIDEIEESSDFSWEINNNLHEDEQSFEAEAQRESSVEDNPINGTNSLDVSMAEPSNNLSPEVQLLNSQDGLQLVPLSPDANPDAFITHNRHNSLAEGVEDVEESPEQSPATQAILLQQVRHALQQIQDQQPFHQRLRHLPSEGPLVLPQPRVIDRDAAIRKLMSGVHDPDSINTSQISELLSISSVDIEISNMSADEVTETNRNVCLVHPMPQKPARMEEGVVVRRKPLKNGKPTGRKGRPKAFYNSLAEPETEVTFGAIPKQSTIDHNRTRVITRPTFSNNDGFLNGTLFMERIDFKDYIYVADLESVGDPNSTIDKLKVQAVENYDDLRDVGDVEATKLRQLSEALKACVKSKKHRGKVTQAEIERLLLESSMKFLNSRACLRETYWDLPKCYRCVGNIRISDLKFVLNTNELDPKSQYYFVATAFYREQVFVSKMKEPKTCDFVLFEDEFIFKNLPVNFRIGIQLHVLKMPKSQGFFKRLFKKPDPVFKPEIRNRMFVRNQTLEFRSPEEGFAPLSHFHVSSCGGLSMGNFPRNRLYLETQSKELYVNYLEILGKHVEDIRFTDILKTKVVVASSPDAITWLPSWCVLKQAVISFYTTRVDYENDASPIFKVDLRNCLKMSFTHDTNIDVDKPRTIHFLVKGIMTKNYYIQYDDDFDFEKWKKQFGFTLRQLRLWKATPQS